MEAPTPGNMPAEYPDRARLRWYESDNDGFGGAAGSACRDACEWKVSRRDYFLIKPM